MRIDFGPAQGKITLDRISEILGWSPRRMRIGGPDWPDILKEPQGPDNDWSMVLPFCETLKNAFEFGCQAQSIGLREGKGRCWTFICDTAGKDLDELVDVREWIAVVGRYVAIRDGLCMSFALDFDREHGDPNAEHTPIGLLRIRAKPYGRAADEDALLAAGQLAGALKSFLDSMRSYRFAKCVAAVPPSRSDKPFDLPRHLAAVLAAECDLEDVSGSVQTVSPRKELKDLPLDEKLPALLDTIEVDPAPIEGRSVLLIDDLYQSGTTANLVAMELLDAGAKRVLGLFCEKTCRNDANVRV
ncbi:hypothetical protein ACFL5T_04670 [Gemmatimonadota bacterium]